MSGLNIKLYDQIEQLSSTFKHARPFEHIVIDDFLSEELCRKLLEEFPSFNDTLAIDENGRVGGKSVHEKVSGLGEAYKELDHLASSNKFIAWVSQLTGIPDLIYDSYYFGGGTHENKNGQGLNPHVDFTHHPITGHYRRLNLIIYLNKEWENTWGGCVQLHENPRLKPVDDCIVSIKPIYNRAVLFATHHHSWHGFPIIKLPTDKSHLSRKSFALYYYTKQPPENFDKTHSTIYVDRHMGEEIQPGYTLTDDDYDELKQLLASRDQHIERLYNIISQMMDDTKKLKKALGVMWKLSWPLRKMRRWWKKES